MSDADDVLLGRAELERAFTALGERLARRGVITGIFIVGGAAMALAYDANRVTRDVDARSVPHGRGYRSARSLRVCGVRTGGRAGGSQRAAAAANRQARMEDAPRSGWWRRLAAMS